MLRALDQDFRREKLRHPKKLEFHRIKAAIRRRIDKGERAAQILGVDKELGSIEAGKRANLVLTNGDILQASTQVPVLFIDGRPVEPVSKHTRLYERYRERLEEVKAGKAPLGTK